MVELFAHSYNTKYLSEKFSQVGHFVCPESSKVNTTRKNMRAIMTKEEAQIVFLDTPGVVNEQTQKKFSLESRLMTGQS